MGFPRGAVSLPPFHRACATVGHCVPRFTGLSPPQCEVCVLPRVPHSALDGTLGKVHEHLTVKAFWNQHLLVRVPESCPHPPPHLRCRALLNCKEHLCPEKASLINHSLSFDKPDGFVSLIKRNIQTVILESYRAGSRWGNETTFSKLSGKPEGEGDALLQGEWGPQSQTAWVPYGSATRRLCDCRQAAQPLWASVSASVKGKQ